MRLDKFFSTPFHYDLCPNVNLETLKNLAYDLEKNDKGRNWSNYGGYQSNDVDLKNPILEPLLQTANKNLLIMHRELGFKDEVIPIIDNLWFNINKPGSYNKPHRHVDNILSGVFYVKCPPNSGKIIFPNPIANAQYHFHHQLMKNLNEYNSPFYEHDAQESKMLIFPSHALHYVEPNASNEDRITIAFNTKLKYA